MKNEILTLMRLALTVAITVMMIPQAQADSERGFVTLYPTDDASIWMQYPDNNYGASDHMGVRNRYGHPSHPDYWEVNALIKFDLSSVPPGATVTSARLHLYYYDCAFANCPNRDLTCYRITSGWNEGTVTWDTQPGHASEVTSHSIVPSTWDWMDWDVASDVQDFVNGHETNQGWEIMDTTTWRDYDIPDSRFRAKEHGDHIPYLEISFSFGCQVSPSSLDFGIVPMGDYHDETFAITNIGDGTLNGTVSESCDHYDVVDGGGPYSLVAGDSLVVRVRFEPTSPGQHSCIVETGSDSCSDVYCTGDEGGGWYWKLPYEDYSPSGVPDIDQKQDNWIKEETGQWTFCGPCAAANCFNWFDAKYNVPPGAPGDGIDMFPLVRDYMDDLPPLVSWDDHDPWNVDHEGTSWGSGIGSPPSTPQPFIPGPQPSGAMPPWGELVERLAWYFDTDGIQTGYCNHTGTNIVDMQQGIQDWLESEMFEDGSYLADTLCVAITATPTFAYVESLVEKSENVILLLGFWYAQEPPVQQKFQEFMRGDINADGIISVPDIIACGMGGPFNCDDAADANDDGVVDTCDCNYLYEYIYNSGPPPPPPHHECGVDPTPDELDCGSYPLCGSWWRVGGHYATVAGVNSVEQKIALSDPFIDAAELGLAEGVVGDGSLIPHPWGSHGPTVHNDEGNVSHDIYAIQELHGPGGLWRLVDYPVSLDPYYWTQNFSAQNTPEEFLAVTQEWDEVSPIFTEVEYCVHISPWDYRGDVNGDGIVDVGDVVYLISYLYRGGPPPDPMNMGDVNCDGIVNLGDVVFLISYLYKSGPVPRCCDP